MSTVGEDAIAALRLLNQEGLGDFIYAIRENELEGWSGPRVINWGKAVEATRLVLERADKEGTNG